MGNLVQKTFSINGSWTAPAGVLSVDVVTYADAPPAIATKGNQAAHFMPTNNRLFAVGDNASGFLGDGTVVNKSSPVAVFGGRGYSQVSTQGGSVVALGSGMNTDPAIAYTWGSNAGGELGDNTTVNKSSPVVVLGNLSFAEVKSYGNTYGLTHSGQLYGWGSNFAGGIGDGTAVPKSTPTLVAGGITFRSIFPSGSGIFAITPTGQMYAWGYNPSGILGDGTIIDKSTPTLVSGGLTWKSVRFYNSVLALTTSGALYAWGNNLLGQLGDGTSVAKSSPVAVLGGLNFVDFQHFNNSVYALTSSGQVWCWGSGFNGELGNNGTGTVSSPVQVSGAQTYKKLLTNFMNYSQAASCYALNTAGALYAWGQNSSGNLGVNDVASRSSPTPVVGGLTFADIYPGSFCMYGVTTAGRLYAWGNNGTSGPLGLGDLVNRSSPVAVLGNMSFASQGITQTTTVRVTPGTAYAISFLPGYTYFGANLVGGLRCLTLTLNYKQ